MIGKVFYRFYPRYCFGDLIFDYWQFEIVKEFPKNYRVKTIESRGIGKSGNDLVKKEGFDNTVFKSIKQGIKFNQKFIKNSIEHLRIELKQYTPKHKKYQEIKDTIFILKEYLSCVNKFSLNELDKTNKKIESYLFRKAKFKEGETVKAELGQKGKVRWIHVGLYDCGFHEELITYGIDYPNGNFSTLGESKLKKCLKGQQEVMK